VARGSVGSLPPGFPPPGMVAPERGGDPTSTGRCLALMGPIRMARGAPENFEKWACRRRPSIRSAAGAGPCLKHS
jgi:hypothetical protein